MDLTDGRSAVTVDPEKRRRDDLVTRNNHVLLSLVPPVREKVGKPRATRTEGISPSLGQHDQLSRIERAYSHLNSSPSPRAPRIPVSLSSDRCRGLTAHRRVGSRPRLQKLQFHAGHPAATECSCLGLVLARTPMAVREAHLPRTRDPRV